MTVIETVADASELGMRNIGEEYGADRGQHQRDLHENQISEQALSAAHVAAIARLVQITERGKINQRHDGSAQHDIGLLKNIHRAAADRRTKRVYDK